MVKKVKSQMKRVYNDVKEQFEEVAKTADDIKPLSMQVSSKLMDITEDDNILQYKDEKIGLIHLKDLGMIREIDLRDVTAIHSSDEGNMYWIAKGKGEIAIYDSAELTLKKSLPALGSKITEITSNSQYAVFSTEGMFPSIYLYDYQDLQRADAEILYRGVGQGMQVKHLTLAKGQPFMTGVCEMGDQFYLMTWNLSTKT